MKTVPIEHLEGAALDWAVAQVDPMCNGLEWKPKSDGRLFVGFSEIDGVMQPCAFLSNGCCISEKLGMIRNQVVGYSPSKNWSDCGSLIESHFMMIDIDLGGEAEAKACLKSGSHWTCLGPSALVAACRAIVGLHSKRDTIEIPDELA